MKTKPTDLRSPRLDSKPTIILAEDHRWYRGALADRLRKDCGVKTLQAEHVLEALRMLDSNADVVAVVADERFPHGPSGTELLRATKRRKPHVRRMLLSAYTSGAMIAIGAEEGFEVHDKALPLDEVASLICAMAKAA
jgi:DNA-binding NarL/FixJ family response regulator